MLVEDEAKQNAVVEGSGRCIAKLESGTGKDGMLRLPSMYKGKELNEGLEDGLSTYYLGRPGGHS